MTGFMGERINRRVGLVTDDFRVYHALAPFFERRGVTVLGLRPGEPVPPSIEALIGGPPDDPRSVAIGEDPETTWVGVMARLDGRGPGRRAVVGIDPGDTFGMALLVDGLVYWWTEAYGADEVIAKIAHWRAGLTPGQWLVRIGDGARRPAFAVSRRIRSDWPDVQVSIVPERGSTPVRPVTESRHTDAAIAIALREP